MRAFGMSDVGRVRENNEDFYLIDAEGEIFLLADGVGGHQAGEIASQIAVDTIYDGLLHSDHMPLEDAIEAAFARANTEILRHAGAHKENRGMGTTIVLVKGTERGFWIANVGDSRCYGISQEGIRQLSVDHSIVGHLVRTGAIAAEAAKRHPDRHIITSALGLTDSFETFKAHYEGGTFSHLVLCSDGLSDLISEAELLEVMQTHDLENAPAALIQRANDAGGTDNITVICIAL